MKIPISGKSAFLTLSFALALLPASAAGLEWKKVAGPEGGDIQGLSAFGDTVMAVTAQGDYFRSVDAGKTWMPLYRSLIPEEMEISPQKWVSEPFFLGNRILGGAPQGGLLIFREGYVDRIQPHLDFSSWTFQPAFIISLGNRLYTASGGVSSSADSGMTWTMQTDFVGNQGPVYSLTTDGVSLYATNGTSDLYASSDQGRTWSPIRQDLGRDTYTGGVTGIPGSLLIWWVDGEVLRLRRQGDTLAALSGRLPGKGPWKVRYTGGKLLVSGSLGISQSQDGGLTWAPLTDASPLPIQTMVELPGGDFLAGTREGIYRWNRLTRQWNLSQAGFNAVEIRYLVKQKQSLLAIAPYSLHRSPDGGTTWHRIPTPGITGFAKLATLESDLFVFDDSGRVFPLGPGDTLGKDIGREFPVIPRDIGRSGKHWIVASSIGMTWISHDDRKTWTSLNDKMFNPNRALMAVQGSRVILQTYMDSLRFSLDTGLTWKPARMPGNWNLQMTLSGNVWLGMGSEGLFRSEDPSTGWQSVTLGTSGARAKQLVENGKVLYAYADIGLYASPDHGATWESVATGMLRGEFATLKTGRTALFAKAEKGSWWVAGLEEEAQTRIRSIASPSRSGWPRLLRTHGRSEPAILDFHLKARTRLCASPTAADGSRIATELRKDFEAGVHEWILPGLDGAVYWSIGEERPGK